MTPADPTPSNPTAAPPATPHVGDPAPPVELPDESGTVHRLADQKGRWTVLYFYPEDDTPGCTTEACQFRDMNEQYADTGAEVWGVSPDSQASHRRFREKFDLPFTLLADVDKAVSTRYGAWREKVNYGKRYMGIGRSTYLIDPDLRVARAWPTVKADGHAAAVLEALAEARTARSA
jgi:thioredoxin-dependent peroxiredoxin